MEITDVSSRIWKRVLTVSMGEQQRLTAREPVAAAIIVPLLGFIQEVQSRARNFPTFFKCFRWKITSIVSNVLTVN